MGQQRDHEPSTPTEILNEGTGKMGRSVSFLKTTLSGIQTGRATPALVNNLFVDYYGTPTPLSSIATISAPDAQLILIQPWDKHSLVDIERAIQKSSLGLNPSNDGTMIRLPIPPLSQERRETLVKSLGKTVEDAKVSIRSIRRDCQDALRALEREKGISQDETKRAQSQLQTMTNDHISSIDTLWKSKVQDMMKI